MERNRQLNREIDELKKEIAFLKKSGGILCERNRLEQYRFIMDNKAEFGLRWLFRRLGVYPNGYYNYLKCRKSGATGRKEKIKRAIHAIYHKHRGVYGYRIIRKLLEKEGITISAGTCRKYMNIELGLKSVAPHRQRAVDTAQRSGKPVHIKGVRVFLREAQHFPKHEQGWMPLRQRPYGEIFQHSEKRVF